MGTRVLSSVLGARHSGLGLSLNWAGLCARISSTSTGFPGPAWMDPGSDAGDSSMDSRVSGLALMDPGLPSVDPSRPCPLLRAR